MDLFYLIPVLASIIIAFGVNEGSCLKPGAPVRDLSQEERNKKIMTDFFDANCKHDLSVFDTYVATDLIQHNPNLADGRIAFKEFSRQLFQSSPTAGCYYVERVAADGDLVWIHLLSPATQHAVVTIFRLKDGLIREHWDVIQPIPETSLNQHPMFNVLASEWKKQCEYTRPKPKAS